MRSDVTYAIGGMLGEVSECIKALRRVLVLAFFLAAAAGVLLLIPSAREDTATCASILLGMAAAGMALCIGCTVILSGRIRTVILLRRKETSELADAILSRNTLSDLSSSTSNTHS